MDFYIVVPVYNEEAHIGQMLESVVNQTVLPKRVVVVDDSSTDGSSYIIKQYAKKFPFIEYVLNDSEQFHQPGSKVVEAFYKGFQHLDDEFDAIGKFDADVILPENYFEKMIRLFTSDSKIGMASGILFIEKEGDWVFENISNKKKVRGPIKLYRKACFKEIEGLKKSIGWDTVDELIARFHGWEIQTDVSVHVKHLKPTGKVYNPSAKRKQGEAFYRMRYGFVLTLIASAKLAYKKKCFGLFWNSMRGFFQAKREKLSFLVSSEEGAFIRNFRWKNILKKFKFGK